MTVAVVSHDGIIKALSRKGDTIFRGDEFFRNLHHVFVGFQIRIGFHGDIELTQGTAQCAFGRGQFAQFNCAQIAIAHRLKNRRCIVAGVDDGLQCLTLMRHIGFSRLYQIGYQIVTPFELHLNLCKGVEITIFECHQGVVDGDGIDHQAQQE